MPDELYSIVVDYLTKGGKLPTITMPPQVVVVGSSGGVGSGKNSALASIASAVITSVVGGLFGAFAKTKAMARIPKKQLGVQTATVFKDKSQIGKDLRARAAAKTTRNELKATALKLDATQKQLAKAQENVIQIPKQSSVAPVTERPTGLPSQTERPRATKIEPQTIQLTPARVKEIALPRIGNKEFASVNAAVKMEKVSFKDIVSPPTPQQQKVIAEATRERGYDNSKANTVIGKQNSLGEVTQ